MVEELMARRRLGKFPARTAMVVAAVGILLGVAGTALITRQPLDFWNNNSTGLTAIFTMILVFVTTVYVLFTGFLVHETRKLREEQTSPHISVHLETRQEWINFIDVVIQNTGGGSAYNIRFSANPDLVIDHDDRLMKINMFRRGIGHLAPGQRLQTFIMSLAGKFDGSSPEAAKIAVTYDDGVGSTFGDEFVLDYADFLGMSQLGEPPMETVAKSLKQLADDLHTVVRGSSKIQVVRHTRQDLADDVARNKARLADLNARAAPTLPDKVASPSEGTDSSR